MLTLEANAIADEALAQRLALLEREMQVVLHCKRAVKLAYPYCY